MIQICVAINVENVGILGRFSWLAQWKRQNLLIFSRECDGQTGRRRSMNDYGRYPPPQPPPPPSSSSSSGRYGRRYAWEIYT